MTVKRYGHLVMGTVASLAMGVSLQTGVTVVRNEALSEFPDAVTFHLSANSDMEIESAEIEFETDALVCGSGSSRAVPKDFVPGKSVETEWEWNLHETGPLPPGTTISWQWVLTDASGEKFVTGRKTLRLVDEAHDWQRVETDSLVLFWYKGTEDFAQALLDSAASSLERLTTATGINMEEQVRIYIYADAEEMRSATLFAPEWSGGQAFANHGAVTIGISPSDLTWGRRVLAHELSHVVVGRYTFSCVAHLPTWLDEGLAMYAEGSMQPYDAVLLSNAIANDGLLSVRELGQVFSNDVGLASLSYVQSLSLVTFLIEEHGQEQMLALLDALREGAPEDGALTQVYGMDRDGLDVAWRQWVGAAPVESGESVGAEPTQTPFPTLAPIAGPTPGATEAPVVAEVPEESAPADEEVSPEEAPDQEVMEAEAVQEEPSQRVPVTLIAVIVAVVLLALTGAGWAVWRRGRTSEKL